MRTRFIHDDLPMRIRNSNQNSPLGHTGPSDDDKLVLKPLFSPSLHRNCIIPEGVRRVLLMCYLDRGTGNLPSVTRMLNFLVLDRERSAIKLLKLFSVFQYLTLRNLSFDTIILVVSVPNFTSTKDAYSVMHFQFVRVNRATFTLLDEV